MLYSAGTPVADIGAWFDGLLRAWEASQELEPTVYSPQIMHSRRHWKGNLDLYIECFWLVGLALALEIPDGQWQRLIALIGNEGQDAVLDRIIASRQPDRRIGQAVLFPKPYVKLHNALLAPAEFRSAALKDFVTHWYAELDRKGSPGRPALYSRPYWYTLGDQNFEGGAYFGRWCIEAVAAAKAFGLDDTGCCGHEHYPGDLLRPDGPGTHPARPQPSVSWWRRWIGG